MATRRNSATKPGPRKSIVALRLDKRGQYGLFDAKRRPILVANRFLAAVAARGLARATVRAYGFDLVVLYRWLDHSGHSLRDLSADKVLDYVGAQRLAGAQPRSINRRL